MDLNLLQAGKSVSKCRLYPNDKNMYFDYICMLATLAVLLKRINYCTFGHRNPPLAGLTVLEIFFPVH